MTVRFSRRAARDMTDIFVHGILTFGEHHATVYNDNLARILSLMDNHPNLGRAFPTRPGLRTFSFNAHIIAYKRDADGIVVIRVLDARRDWRSLLDY
jgi:toxin ParE1/3/4